MPNANLSAARRAKNDEFYTQWHDIEVEINAYLDFDADVFRNKTVLLPCDDPEWSNFTKFFAQNFDRFGLKKLISTSYAPESKRLANYVPSLFEQSSEQFDELKSRARGKIFVLNNDIMGDGRVDINDLQWQYLDGDGDFRSDEVTRLRNEADIIITNPPFSMFREFIPWALRGGKRCIAIGNQNAITYKEIFALIKENSLWLGATGFNNDMVFGVPDGAEVAESDRQKAARMGYVGNYTRLGNSCWFTNVDHGRRHQPLVLMTMADNLRYSRHKDLRALGEYQHYDNYDAIEVPYIDAIPSDYDGVMGVPITMLDKHCSEQFEIVGAMTTTKVAGNNYGYPYINGVKKYARVLIRHKR